MEKEIIEGNELIRCFDNPLMKIIDGWVCGGGEKLYPVESLNYHKDWNALMPVVEKIENTSASFYYGFKIMIGKRYACIYAHQENKQDGVLYQTPYGFNPDSKLHAVWLAVVDFIKWYNSQTQ